MRRLDSPDVDVRKQTLRKLADEGAPAASDEALVERLLDLTTAPIAADRRESRYTLERIGVRGRVIFSHLLHQLDQPEIRTPSDGGAKLSWISDLLSRRARPRGVKPLMGAFHRFVNHSLDGYTHADGTLIQSGLGASESGQIFKEEAASGEIFDHIQAMRSVAACDEVFLKPDLPPKEETLARYRAILHPDAPPSRPRILAAIGAGQTNCPQLLTQLIQLQHGSRRAATVCLDAPRRGGSARGSAPRAVRFSDAVDRSVCSLQARLQL